MLKRSINHLKVYLLFFSLPIFLGMGAPHPSLLQQKTITESCTFKEGDILFQSLQNVFGKAIEAATHSKYSHCGIVLRINDSLFVFEAMQPVKYTAIEQWINNGKDKHYVVKRLIDSSLLNLKQIMKLKTLANTYRGKDYDSYFEWNDDRMYCSELVWKMYKESMDIELSAPSKLKDFDLTDRAVRLILRRKFGANIPLEEKVVSPQDIYDSKLLQTVCTH